MASSTVSQVPIIFLVICAYGAKSRLLATVSSSITMAQVKATPAWLTPRVVSLGAARTITRRAENGENNWRESTAVNWTLRPSCRSCQIMPIESVIRWRTLF